MSIFDPPSDPYGDEKRCRICDELLEYNPLVREWECIHDHEAAEKCVQSDVCRECGTKPQAIEK